MQKTSIELKRLARMSLSGKYGVPIGAYLIYIIISLIISFVIQTLIYPNNEFSTIIFTIITFIVSLIEGVIAFGLMKLYLDISRNEPLELGTLTYGFTHHPDRIIIVTLLVSLIILAWLIPAFILLMIYFLWNSPLVFLLFILALIVGMIMSVIYSLKYSQALFILADDSEITAIGSLKESKRMMKGNLGRLFYLQISFIGWVLLGFLSCSIGFIWILPYMGVCSAHFYLDLKDSKSSSGSSSNYSHNRNTGTPEW